MYCIGYLVITIRIVDVPLFVVVNQFVVVNEQLLDINECYIVNQTI